MSLRSALHEEWIYRPFVATSEMRYAPGLPPDSEARGFRLRPLRAVIRPWSPQGTTDSGIWVERHHEHPRIWGWLLAATREDIERYDLKLGSMYVYRRFADEWIGQDAPAFETYIGEKLPVAVIRLDQFIAEIAPAPLALPV